MTALKTLKDIPWVLGEFTLSDIECGIIQDKVAPLVKYKKAVRLEAIKWVKLRRESAKESFPNMTAEAVKLQGKDFIDFFNLSEDDIST